MANYYYVETATWPRWRMDRLRDAWLAGTSASTIARDMGIGKHAVVGKAHRMGLPAREAPHAIRNPLSAEEREQRAEAKRIRLETLAVLPSMPDPADPLRREKQPCQWPVGDPRAKGFRMCEAAPLPGRVYCEAHCAKAYIQPAMLAAFDEATVGLA